VWNTSNVFYAYYDNLNRLRRVYQSGPTGAVAMKMVYFYWDKLDRLTNMNRYEYHDGLGWKGTVDDIYTYDADSRLTALAHKKSTTTLASYTWTYDQASRPTAFTSSLDGTAGYTYDATSQLTGADYNYQTDEGNCPFSQTAVLWKGGHVLERRSCAWRHAKAGRSSRTR